MKSTAIDRTIYLLTGIACSVFVFSWSVSTQSALGIAWWWAALLRWLFAVSVPLFFVFAYPRFVFKDPSSKKSWMYAGLTHAVGLAAAASIFPRLVLPAANPVLDNSILIPVVLFVVFACLLVSALFLLSRGRSTFTQLAAFLIWPYWLLLAIAKVDRYFGADPVPYFLAFVAPCFFAFAAGSVCYRLKIPHVTVCLGCISSYWIYRTVIPNQVLGNVWVMFNHDSRLPWSGVWDVTYATTAIVCVAMLIVAAVTALVRLFPPSWSVRGLVLSEQTWPAFVICLLFLGVWFTHSVMPYRIPGAVDGDWAPTVQILHLQKHGLQFHEKYVGVTTYRGQLLAVRFTEDDRKLLHHTFEQRSATALNPSQDLAERIHTLFPPDETRRSELIKPVRSWTADNWYVYSERRGYSVYGTINGTAPPNEIINLFQDLNGLSKSRYDTAQISDVCLGFCFDPLSAMGSLYANHRCSTDIHGNVSCR